MEPLLILTGLDKFNDIGNKLLEADRFGVRCPLGLITDVHVVFDNWPKFAKEVGLNAKTVDATTAAFELV